MKKFLKIIFFFSFYSIMVSPSPLIARQEKLEQIRERVRENIESRHQLSQEHRATIAAKLTQRHQERIHLFFNRLTKRMQAAISRLHRLIARIESRLAKIEAGEEGIETEDVKDILTEARKKLAQAETALVEAEASLEGVLSSEDPKEAFKDTRDLIKGVKNQLVEVHQLLVQVIGNIKGLRVGQTQNESGE